MVATKASYCWLAPFYAVSVIFQTGILKAVFKFTLSEEVDV